MKTQTRKNILNYIKSQGQTTAHQLVNYFGITQAMVHRHLNKLLLDGSIKKVGKPPKVFYIASSQVIKLPSISNLLEKTHQLIESNWLYVNPEGELVEGLEGFLIWAQLSHQKQDLQVLAEEYVRYLNNAQKLRNQMGLIEAREKIATTFSQVWLEQVFYLDFYSLPKFGKTKLGTLVLLAKQNQSLVLIQSLASQVEPVLLELIEHFQVDTLAYIPHSIKRQVEFLPTLRDYFSKLNLPHIPLVKAYAGQVPVAQKSLSRLEERVENAQKTIFISSPTLDRQKMPKRVLLIDDAVGSGATLNETAQKLKKRLGVKEVIGFSLVGSLKGFPVITEI